MKEIKLSPSRIGTYVETKCRRKIWYEFNYQECNQECEGIQVENVTADDKDNGYAEAGNEWEIEVVNRFLNDSECDVIVADDEDKKFTEEKTKDVIISLGEAAKNGKPVSKKSTAKRLYLYQLCLSPASLLSKDKPFSTLKMDKYRDQISWGGYSYPDIIRVEKINDENKYKLKVIDIKGSSCLKEGYQVQIALYAKMLKSLIEKQNLSDYLIVEDEGSVWNKGNPHHYNNYDDDTHNMEKGSIRHELYERIFDLNEAYRELNFFFEETNLDQFVGENIGNISCMRSNACSFCDAKDTCFASLVKEKNVKILPQITIQAQLVLDELNITKCDDLFEIIGGDETNADYVTVNRESFLKDVCVNKEQYKECVESICNNKDTKCRQVKDATTKQFPKVLDENCYNLILSAQKDPMTGRVYAYARYLHRANLDFCADADSYKSFFSKNRTKEALDKNDEAFVKDLCECLDKINNEFVHIFFMDGYEKQNVMNALYGIINSINQKGLKSLDDKGCFIMDEKQAKLYRDVQRILFIMPDERLASYSDSLPKKVCSGNVSVISSVIKRLYLIPTDNPFYDLFDLSEAFDFKFTETEKKEFRRYVGICNAINNNRIRDIWKRKEDISKLEAHYRKRIELEIAIINGIQNDETNKKIIISKTYNQLNSERLPYYRLNYVWCDSKPRIKERLLYAADYEVAQRKSQVEQNRSKSIKASKEDGTFLYLQFSETVEVKSTDSTSDDDTAIKYKYKIENYADFVGNMWFAGVLIKDQGSEEENKKIILGTDFESVDEDSKTYTIVNIPRNVEEGEEGEYYITLDRRLYTDESADANIEEKYILIEYHEDLNLLKTKESINKADKMNVLTPADMVFKKPKDKILGANMKCDLEAVQGMINNFSHMDGYGFSPSQEKAFSHMCENKLTLLAGPPAAGKTDFIARSVITLSDYYWSDIKQQKDEKKRPLSILVSAMSHAAIDNILLKLQEKLEATEQGKEIKLYKADKIENSSIKKNKDKDRDRDKENSTEDKEKDKDKENSTEDKDKKRIVEVKEFRSKTARTWTKISGALWPSSSDNSSSIEGDNSTYIIGATGWALYKYFSDNNDYNPMPFDLIIIDEASQVRAMDAFLQLNCSNEKTRFVLVGDNHQLPPIISGDYDPDANSLEVNENDHPKDKISLFSSIFDYVESSLKKVNRENDICRLNDNFRMNSILCRYSAKAIYGDKYRAFDKDIAGQILKLDNIDMNKQKDTDEFIDDILDPKYPLVFCKLSGGMSDQRELDLNIVNMIVKRLWIRTSDASGDSTDSERDKKIEAFWDKKCGIISPYHAQIKSVKSYVSKSLKCNANDIFIGTVDKLQGQERDTVIVTYGMYDEDKLKTQSEFIFSKNRFNVSLTRGKKKTIVILSDVIAESNLTSNVLRNKTKTMREGIDFVHGFAKYMSSQDTESLSEEKVEEYKSEDGENNYYDLKYENRDRQYRRREEQWINGASVEMYAKKTYFDETDNVNNNDKLILIETCKEKDKAVNEIKNAFKNYANEKKKILIISAQATIESWREMLMDTVFPIDIRDEVIFLKNKSMVHIVDNSDEGIKKIRKDDYSLIYIDNSLDRTMKQSFMMD